MTPPDPGVVITTTQMFQELRQVHDEVKGLRSDLKALMEDRTDHENRIRALEQTVWRAAGGAAVFGAGAGILAQFLMR